MEFIQSRFQNVFSRFYEMLCGMLWYVVFALVFSYFFSSDLNLLTSFIITVVFTFCSVCYFVFVYKDASKLIRVNDAKFVLVDYKTVTEINWEDFQGYKISKTIPYQVIIKSKVYGTNTRFSYYAFSSKQRKQLFEVLQSK